MWRTRAVCVCTLFLIVLVLPAVLRADDDEFDNAKRKLQLNGWISSPSGYFNGHDGEGYFDVQRDFGFGDYVTFAGKWDWRFKRKHHLIFGATPIVSSRTTALNRTITWQDQTFNVGAQVNANIKSLIFTPGYQYDFFRFRQIWLGLLVNVNLAYTRAALKSSGVVSGGNVGASGAASASGSVCATSRRWPNLSLLSDSESQTALRGWHSDRHVFLRLRQLCIRKRCDRCSHRASLGRTRWLFAREPL
jgi:hypothetical protein